MLVQIGISGKFGESGKARRSWADNIVAQGPMGNSRLFQHLLLALLSLILIAPMPFGATSSIQEISRPLQITPAVTPTKPARPMAMPLAQVLKSDGTLNLATGFTGSLDLRGWRMNTRPDGAPYFVPDTTVTTAEPDNHAAVGVVRPQDPDDNWDDRFGSTFAGSNSPSALVVSGTNVYVGGGFYTVGGVSARNVALWNGSSWSALGSGVGTGPGDYVGALAVQGNRVYAGGEFTQAGGVNATYIAMWDGNNWSPLGGGVGGTVRAIALSGSNVYVGGNFLAASGRFVYSIAMWDGSNWLPLGTGLAMGGGIGALALSGNILYAGGQFSNIGGISANNIARWNGSSWSALGGGVNGAVDALAMSGSNLYVGGDFMQAGGMNANHMAMWDGSNWSALGSGIPSFFDRIGAIAVAGSKVYVGGSFTQAGGTSANNIAMWNGSSWSALGSGVNNWAYTLTVGGNDIYVGGAFVLAGNKPSLRFAIWHEPGPPPPMSITSVQFSHQSYPDSTWVGVPVSTIDGNIVKIQAIVSNPAPITQTATIAFLDEFGRTLPRPTSGAPNPVSAPIPPGQSLPLDYLWDTSGFAWNADGTPNVERHLQIVLAGQSPVLQRIPVKPRPVILVHGWRSDASTWDLYQGFLNGVRPLGEWRAYAVGDGQVPGRMNTDHTPTNHISDNARILGTYIEGVRDQQNAWHVDIVAHSMGGLISRQYIQDDMPYTHTQEGDTTSVASHLIMLGTPNMGSACADILEVLHNQTPSIPDVLPWPATHELTSWFVVDAFNPRVTNQHGVPFAILAGIFVPRTCHDPSPGDTVVSEYSAVSLGSQRGWYIDTFIDHHIHEPKSESIFDNYVVPLLSNQISAQQVDHAKQADSVVADSLPAPPDLAEDRPQILLAAGRQVPAAGSADLPIVVSTGGSFGIVMPSLNAIGATLSDPSQTVIDTIPGGSERAQAALSTFDVASPVPGSWTLHFVNTTTIPLTVTAAVWITGSPLYLDLGTGRPSADGHLLITATLTNAGAPVTGSTLTTTISGDLAPILTMPLLDDGQHGDGQANDGIYGGTAALPAYGLYNTIVRADTGTSQRLTARVLQYAATMPPTCPLTFTDVPSSNSFYTYIRCLACQSIIGGYPDGTFRPGTIVTRGQLSKIIANSAGFQNVPTGQTFADVPPGSTFYVWVEQIAARNIISGYPCGQNPFEPCIAPGNRPYFRPGANATRSQIAKIAANTAGYSDDVTNSQTFADVPPTSTFWIYIERIALRGIISGYPCGGPGEPCDAQQSSYFRPGAPATRGQIAKIDSSTFFPGCQPPGP